MNNKYVLVKLETGEQLMAKLLSENANTIMIQSPMVIRQTIGVNPATGGQVEKLTSAPFCQFTKDRIFTFKKEHIMFVNDLHPMVIDQYLSMVNIYEKEVDVYKTEDGYLKYGSNPEEQDTLDYLLDEMDNKSSDDDDYEYDENEDNEEETYMTVDDLKKTVSALASILEEDKTEEYTNNTDVIYIDGNDTIN